MKKAIVLGASGGLGRAITEELVKEGYLVIGTYNKTKKEELTNNKNIKWTRLDLEDKKSLNEFLEEIKNEKIDFFTSTIAHTFSMGKFEEILIENFKKTFDVGFFKHIEILQKLSKQLNDKANIVLILSARIDSIKKDMSPYVTSKYALLGLVKSLSKDWEERKIRVNALSPEMMDTKFSWKMEINGKYLEIPKGVAEIKKKEERLVTTKSVAEKIIFIINNDKINGENFLIK